MRKRWKPGYAKRIAAVTKGLLPWQEDLLQRMENADVDAVFRDMTGGLPRPDVPNPPARGCDATFFEIDGEGTTR